MNSIRVGVTGFISSESPKPGFNVARSLKEGLGEGVHIVALDSYPLTASIALPTLVDETHLIPPPSDGPNAMLEYLKELTMKGPLDVLIPNDDIEVELLAGIRENVEGLGIKLALPTTKALKLRSKENLYSSLIQHGYSAPKTVVLFQNQDVARIGDQLGYPLVVKGRLCDAYLAQSLAEAKIVFERIAETSGLPVIVQQFVPGEEYSVTAVADGQNRAVGIVAIKKIGITEKGKTWAGVTIEAPWLIELGKKVVADLGWVGPIEIEFIKSEERNEWFVIEINPQFPSWI